MKTKEELKKDIIDEVESLSPNHVYVVTKGWYDNTEVIACFRDKHKAKEYCDKKNKISNESKGSRYYYEFVGIQILD